MCYMQTYIHVHKTRNYIEFVKPSINNRTTRLQLAWVQAKMLLLLLFFIASVLVGKIA